MSEYLTNAAAAWDRGPAAGEWIAPLLDEFGATLGHAVPAGYDAYVVVPIPRDGDDAELGDYDVLDAIVDSLRETTGDQPVHTALWEGWGWLYDSGDDPRTAPGCAVLVSDPTDEAVVREAQEAMARRRVARPAVDALALPHRNYYLWTGPLDSAAALRHQHCIPSLIWPDDTSWFIGAPIYTDEIAVGADGPTAEAILAAPALASFGARRAERTDVLRIDD